MGRRILVAGTINTDLVVRTRRAPEAGETITGLSFASFGGGKGANQAVAAARAGGEVSMLSGVGIDDFGRQRRADLEAEFVSTAAVITTDRAASGVALITVEESGQNRIAYVPGAGWEVSPSNAIAALDLVRPDIVLSTLELKLDTLKALFQAAQDRRITMICNGTPEPLEGRELIPFADVLIVNEQEALELAGEPERDWMMVAAALAELGPPIVILTLGAEGALVWAHGSAETIANDPCRGCRYDGSRRRILWSVRRVLFRIWRCGVRLLGRPWWQDRSPSRVPGRSPRLRRSRKSRKRSLEKVG